MPTDHLFSIYTWRDAATFDFIILVLPFDPRFDSPCWFQKNKTHIRSDHTSLSLSSGATKSALSLPMSSVTLRTVSDIVPRPAREDTSASTLEQQQQQQNRAIMREGTQAGPKQTTRIE